MTREKRPADASFNRIRTGFEHRVFYSRPYTRGGNREKQFSRTPPVPHIPAGDDPRETASKARNGIRPRPQAPRLTRNPCPVRRRDLSRDRPVQPSLRRQAARVHVPRDPTLTRPDARLTGHFDARAQMFRRNRLKALGIRTRGTNRGRHLDALDLSNGPGSMHVRCTRDRCEVRYGEE